ncbi:MAG: hypothetical protein SGILL_003005 [Bacillariaceae sp.]
MEWPLNDVSASIREALLITAATADDDEDKDDGDTTITMERVYERCTDRMKHRIEAARRRQRQVGIGATAAMDQDSASQEAAATHYFSDPGSDLFSVDEAIPDAVNNNDDDTQEDLMDEPIFEMEL